MAQSLQDNTRNVLPLLSSPQHSISITLEHPNSSSYTISIWEGRGRKILSPRLVVPIINGRIESCLFMGAPFLVSVHRTLFSPPLLNCFRGGGGQGSSLSSLHDGAPPPQSHFIHTTHLPSLLPSEVNPIARYRETYPPALLQCI